MTRRALLLVLLAASVAACDLSPTVDVDTPDFEQRLSLRAVLGAGQVASFRVGLARDPFAIYQADADRAVPDDVVLTLWRGDELIETVPFRSQTCYQQVASVCDAETGETIVTRSGPFECGRYVGTARMEPGEVRMRAERDGFPTAEATVTIPAPPVVTARATGETGAADGRLGFSFDLDDDPTPGSQYGVSLLREFDRQRSQVCAVGGLRDTTFVLSPRTYQTSFGTSDPVLRPAAREVDGSHQLIVFDDAAFAGTRGSFTLDASPEGASSLLGTGRFVVQIAALSPTLSDYLRETAFALDTETPFDEPANLPTNVTGGYGHIGTIAVTEALAE